MTGSVANSLADFCNGTWLAWSG